MPGHVFISYANQDSASAELLLNALERREVKCWMAPRDIPPGGSYAGAILGAIESSNCFVLIYSKNANASVHVVREVERALKFKHNIIPIRLDDSVLSQSLEYLLATVQWLSLPEGPTTVSVNKVADQIASSLSPPVSIPPASAAPSGAVPARPGLARRPWWVLSFAALVFAFIIFLVLHRPVQISSAPPPPPSPTVIANTPAPSSPTDFVEDFVKTLGSSDPANQLSNYADRVEYYDLGIVKKDTVRRDLEHDINAWPNRVYSIHEKPKITKLSADTYKAEFPMTYTLANNKGLSSGILQMDIRFQLHEGRFQVTAIKKTTILAAKKR